MPPTHAGPNPTRNPSLDPDTKATPNPSLSRSPSNMNPFPMLFPNIKHHKVTSKRLFLKTKIIK